MTTPSIPKTLPNERIVFNVWVRTLPSSSLDAKTSREDAMWLAYQKGQSEQPPAVAAIPEGAGPISEFQATMRLRWLKALIESAQDFNRANHGHVEHDTNAWVGPEWVDTVHEALDDLMASAEASGGHRFQKVFCSACGGDFGPGDGGYSNCADHTPAPDASDDLAMLVKQLAHNLRKAAPDNALPDKAMDYLKGKGLQGSALRAPQPPAGQQDRDEALKPFADSPPDAEARTWAWEQVREQVGTKGWTVGEASTYFGFFCWGWQYRAQLEKQRAPATSGEATAGYRNRLLSALERANAAESALRALVDECDNDKTPGWEDRMSERIEHANKLLAAAPVRGLPLTEGQIEDFAKELSWLGFRKDENDEYTIPVIGGSTMKLIRKVEAHHGIGSTAPGGEAGK